jgi:type VI secretion system protein VasG
MGLDYGALVKKLNRPCTLALQNAAALCVTRTNPSVEVEHWLLKLVEQTDSDLPRIFRHFGVDPSHVVRDLTRTIDQFKTGTVRGQGLSPSIDQLIREAWVLASIQYQARVIRSGTLLLALLDSDRLGRLAREASRELARIEVGALYANLARLVAGSPEDEGPAPADSERPAGEPGGGAGAAAGAGAASRTPALDQYTINLTERARAGKIDPVVGRDPEIGKMVDILLRRRQNNPILTGEAGVGKTAVVEGMALRIASGDVPKPLKNVVLRTLDLGLLQAGAGIKGEFENRLKQVIAEVKASPVPVVLFIDEAHTMIGAGAQAGQSDAANLLKPALARGELRTIAATTWTEYKKSFENDPALKRRFQVIKVEEPDEPLAVIMMRGIVGHLEEHHGVRILDEAIEASVKLSHRYLSDRQLPDKSVSLLDTASARVALGLSAVPPTVEECRNRIEYLKVEIGILDRENATLPRHDERLAERRAELARAEGRLAELEARWEQERKLVEEIRALTERIEAQHSARNAPAASQGPPSPPPAELAALRAELAGRTESLRALQGESPLMPVRVDAQTIAEVIASWTGIPVGKMLADEIKTVLNLKTRLEERIIGQSQALEAIAQRIRTSRANLTDPRRPVGVFLMVGPSGVGKTETALALADTLYGGERNMVTINMSEYQEPHSVSGLKGSPPGYVGHEEGGVLTEAVRRKPYCVVLLDEIEKADKEVMELFFQVFDKGILEDTKGREADFKNTLILLTSNVGTDTIMRLCADPDTMPDASGLAEALRPDLLKVFPPAFLGRLILVPYYPISDDVMKQIIRLQLGRIAARMQENHKAQFTYGDDVVASIAGRCTEVESGARNVDHILTRTLLPEMSQEFLTRMAANQSITKVHVSVDDKGAFQYAIS